MRACVFYCIIFLFRFFFYFVAWWHNKKLADSVHSRRVALRRVCQRAEQSKSRGAAQSSAASDKSQSQNLATLRPGQRHTQTHRGAGSRQDPKTLPPSSTPATLTPTKQLRKKTTETTENRRRRRGSSSSEKSEVSIKAHTGQNSFQPVPGSLV